MIKVIIFDFDGVIADSVDIKTKAFGELFEDEGGDFAGRVVDYHLKNTGVSRYEKFRHIYKNMLNRELSDEKFRDLCSRFESLVTDNVVKAPFIKGAKEFLEEHSGEYACFVASATPQKEIEDIVMRKGLGGYFKGIYGAPFRKSDAVKEIIAKQGVEAGEVLYAGDAMSDYNAAKGSSANFVAVAEEDSPVFSGVDCLKIRDLKGFDKLVRSL
ncbi:MAG: HAD-IA family hydrolase [Candidatus Omnitrophota bacterium]